jgi:hypothetical protein
MPREGSEYRYRIKSLVEAHVRVANESDLSADSCPNTATLLSS